MISFDLIELFRTRLGVDYERMCDEDFMGLVSKLVVISNISLLDSLMSCLLSISKNEIAFFAPI